MDAAEDGLSHFCDGPSCFTFLLSRRTYASAEDKMEDSVNPDTEVSPCAPGESLTLSVDTELNGVAEDDATEAGRCTCIVRPNDSVVCTNAPVGWGGGGASICCAPLSTTRSLQNSQSESLWS